MFNGKEYILFREHINWPMVTLVRRKTKSRRAFSEWQSICIFINLKRQSGEEETRDMSELEEKDDERMDSCCVLLV